MTAPPAVVISLHGIKTRGVWQKDLAPELALAGYIPYVLDYGNLWALQMLLRGTLDKNVDWLVKEYDRIVADTRCRRPSIIAHSFGTLQVARLLEKYDHVVFDKVILAAGIVPLDYDWPHLLDANRVSWVSSNFGGKDRWPRVAARFVPHAGNSGTAPFRRLHRALHQVAHPHHGHSSYFSQGNFRQNWIPTLQLDKRAVVDRMHVLVGLLAKKVGLPRHRLRCFVLVRDAVSGSLKVGSGLHLGEASRRELDVAIPLDTEGLGAAPALAFNEMREIRQSAEDLKLLAEGFGGNSPLHPDLKWSIAMPIPSGDSFESACGVLVMDGLVELKDSSLANELIDDENVFTGLVQLGSIIDAGTNLPR